MIKKYRTPLVVFAIATLIALNALRWWPASEPMAGGRAQVPGSFSVEEFEVLGIPEDLLPPFSRDIFHPNKSVSATPRLKAAPVVVQSAPVKSPEELARESAQAEFSQIRCVGVSVRNDRTQAYVINAGEPFLISNGDKVGSRFVVEKIVPDGVYLRDPDTEVGGLVSISGK